jgi:hypothetical protein
MGSSIIGNKLAIAKNSQIDNRLDITLYPASPTIIVWIKRIVLKVVMLEKRFKTLPD